MKIIEVSPSSPLDITIHPDSSILQSGKVYFLPEDDAPVKAAAHIAFRICRLGKNISTKYAPRYYDAATVAFRTFPANGIPKGQEGIYAAMDASTLIGDWQDISLTNETIKVTINGNETDISPMADIANRAITEISRNVTFKIGDILMLPAFAETPIFTHQSHLRATINASETFTLKIV